MLNFNIIVFTYYCYRATTVLPLSAYPPVLLLQSYLKIVNPYAQPNGLYPVVYLRIGLRERNIRTGRPRRPETPEMSILADTRRDALRRTGYTAKLDRKHKDHLADNSYNHR